MPRSKKGLKRRGCDKTAIDQAVKAVIDDGMSVRTAAQQNNVNRETLRRYVDRKKAGVDVSNATRQVFTPGHDAMLIEYIIRASKWCFRLTIKEVKKLAFQFAIANKLNVPESWTRDSEAGDMWYRLFRNKYKAILSLRKPEATSLGRMAAFNKANVNSFFDKLLEVYERQSWSPYRIWNLDETGCSTVHKPRILAATKDKQVSAASSGERGVNVTMIGAISAAGTFIPPALIFPRVHAKSHMINGAPAGSLCLAAPSGWSNEELFVEYLKHFILHVQPSKENMAFIVMDNHESHLSIKAIDMAREHGIVFLTFPPHTSHKLQPLDRTVFGPFKTYFNQATKEWMLCNPGKPVSIYDIAGLVGKAFPKAFTPTNITSGFVVAGIWPLNRDIFEDSEFLSAEVTNRPYKSIVQGPHEKTPEKKAVTPQQLLSVAFPAGESSHDGSYSGQCALPASSPLSVVIPAGEPSRFEESDSGLCAVSPEDIRPFPRAPPWKQTSKGRKPGKSRIETDSQEKEELEKRKKPAVRPLFQLRRPKRPTKTKS